MKQYPRLVTDRLILREHTLADAADVQRYAGDKEVAATTLNIPYPYRDGMAEIWISSLPELYEQNEGLILAIIRKIDKKFIGAISLMLDLDHLHANLGYYLGKPFWGKGYATEATKAVLHYSFTELKLNRVYARHFKSNATSGRVLQKLGMRHEGCLRQHIIKWGEFIDLELYGILRSDYFNLAAEKTNNTNTSKDK